MTSEAAATRPGWDDYYLAIAQTVASRADCSRARHGAVIVDPERRVVSFGYNGAPAGMPGCLEGACPRGRLPYGDLGARAGGYDDPTAAGYCIAVHAEANAIILAGRRATAGATIYITGEPCHGCRKLIAAAGIARVIYPGVSA